MYQRSWWKFCADVYLEVPFVPVICTHVNTVYRLRIQPCRLQIILAEGTCKKVSYEWRNIYVSMESIC